MKNFFRKTALKFQHFMIGRYGMDALYKALFVFYLISIVLGAIINNFSKTGYYIISILSTLLIVFAFYRVFSKNIEMRRKENNDWLSFTLKFKKRFKLIKDKWTFRKTHVFKKCPSCKAVLRLKRKKGQHNVCCPQCKKDFTIRVH